MRVNVFRFCVYSVLHVNVRAHIHTYIYDNIYILHIYNLAHSHIH